MKKVFAVTAALALLGLSIAAQAAITIDTVAVGNAGNAADTQVMTTDHTTGYGSVGYNYNIGKYEVTAGQYTAFLNAKASVSDTYGLYNSSMWNGSYSCKIQQSGNSGNYSYSVASDYANRPVNYVSYWDSCRFANWLGNGQGNGDTETGAYTLNGYTGHDGRTIQRNAGATWVLTSEDEWYKAAYYKGGNTNAGYWLYPTGSDTAPGQDMADASGNNANYWTAPYAWPIDSGKYTTVAGEFQNSDSPYGTFDQGGNVDEWNEAMVIQDQNYARRGLRGGSFSSSDFPLQSSARNTIDPINENGYIGFRVSEVRVTIETVAVGNAGNAGELSGSGAGGYGPDRICGSVGYNYNIGKYEVTAGQYTAFLTAVAATDTYALYNTMMPNTTNGCGITRGGSSGSYTYTVASAFVNRPVSFVSWGDSARFANWLHNGQPTGAQDLATTEDGAYYLNGATTNAQLLAVNREADWRWAITNEDEWYKAAYHKNDGVTGNYFDYPTSSNTAPGRDMADASGNNANYFTGGSTYPIDSPYYTTVAGEFQNSDSPYGTFDQGGNVWEWNEALLYGAYRVLWGGSYNYGILWLQASVSDLNSPNTEGSSLGFRVSEVVTEPPYGINNRAAYHPIISTALANFNFKVWGKVTILVSGDPPVSGNSFTVDDGSGAPVNVVAPGFSGIQDGDYASAKGKFSGEGPSRVLNAQASDVVKLQ